MGLMHDADDSLDELKMEYVGVVEGFQRVAPWYVKAPDVRENGSNDDGFGTAAITVLAKLIFG